ncbi:hypothetical protein ACEYYB_12845 [Paracoccus sp. p4-l81]|uniref:hypothetical protein n=1 Tax=unclassified Paracoccus (in: a-proteobacteria) TaxID=2688777 RepID=UPI0035BA8C3E
MSSDDMRRAATYGIYRALFAARSAYPAKTLRSVLTELLYAEPLAWRVVGVTRAALAAYRDAGFRPITGIERAHLTDRHRTIAALLDGPEPLPQEALFRLWDDADRVVIALRAENRSGVLSDWLPIRPDTGFFPRRGIGFAFRIGVEGALMRDLAAQQDRGAPAS